MKTQSIETQAIITGIRAKVDGSLGLSVSTPELTPNEKVLFMNLQNQNVRMTIVPTDEEPTEMAKVEQGFDGKSPNQRLYGIMFKFWKEFKEKDYPDFETWRRSQLDKIGEQYKSKF